MTDLPSGTLTLLFTDLESSTRLLQQLGDAYAAVLDDQRTILRTAFAAWNGREIDTQGDAFFVAFPRALDALNCVVEAQQALARHPWPAGFQVRARMGLHTGEPIVARTGYVGQDVHRAARIAAAGHGGQVLLSQTTRDLVEGSLPTGVTLRDLGEHRLKDLRRPRQLYQLVIAGLPADFPPLKSLTPDRHNLPIQLTSFIGRERDIAAVKRLLATTRLLTLTGVGGTGKTRLALQVAADLVDQNADGLWLVELAALADPALVPRTVAATFSLRDQAGRSTLEILVDYLRPRAVLLILDNCEHLIEACAQLVDTLLHNCPQVQVLATSREGLGIAGEVTWSVPSLSVPDVRQTVDLDTVSASEAVRLFVQRAQAAKPELALTEQNAGSVARLCQRLDGIPLAIELAAARARVLTVEQIATRLDDRFRLLTGGSRTALERQQTLRATMDWSYQLLSAPERVILQRLSVFSGGWTLEAAEQICSGDGLVADDVLDLLGRLVSKSLIVMSSEDADAPRYHLLETIRQYAREKLLESDAGASLRDRHLAFYLKLGEDGERKLKTAERLVRMRQLRTELDNFRAALEWSLADRDPVRAAQGLRLASALRRFWHNCGYFAEGRGWLEKGLAELVGTQSGLTEIRAKALYDAGSLTWFQGDAFSAMAMLEDSIALYRQANLADQQYLADALNLLASAKYYQDPALARALTEESVRICRALGRAGAWHLAESLFWAGHMAYLAGDAVTARARAEESRALYRQSGDVWSGAAPNSTLGHIAARQGDYVGARSIYEVSLQLWREGGDTWAVAFILDWLGDIDRSLVDYGALSAHSQASLSLWRDMGHKWGIFSSLRKLGIAAAYQGDYERARVLLRDSLGPLRESILTEIAADYSPDTGDYYAVALTLAGLSEVARARGQRVRAARLLGGAEAMVMTIAAASDINDTASFADPVEYERLVSAGRGQLQDPASAAARADGQSMTWEQALAYAAEDDEPAAR